MNEGWQDDRARRISRNPLDYLDVQPPLYREGQRLVLRLSKKSALGIDTDGLTVNFDPETMALRVGSPWRLASRAAAKPAVVAEEGYPKPLGFLSW